MEPISTWKPQFGGKLIFRDLELVSSLSKKGMLLSLIKLKEIGAQLTQWLMETVVEMFLQNFLLLVQISWQIQKFCLVVSLDIWFGMLLKDKQTLELLPIISELRVIKWNGNIIHVIAYMGLFLILIRVWQLN